MHTVPLFTNGIWVLIPCGLEQICICLWMSAYNRLVYKTNDSCAQTIRHKLNTNLVSIYLCSLSPTTSREYPNTRKDFGENRKTKPWHWSTEARSHSKHWIFLFFKTCSSASTDRACCDSFELGTRSTGSESLHSTWFDIEVIVESFWFTAENKKIKCQILPILFQFDAMPENTDVKLFLLKSKQILTELKQLTKILIQSSRFFVSASSFGKFNKFFHEVLALQPPCQC